MNIRKFQTEYRKNPIGIDVAAPRFSWIIETEKENAVQTSYQIQITSDNKEVWNTGKVESDQSVLVEYKGAMLTPETEYCVTLTVWNNFGEKTQTEAFFETGLLHPEKMDALWITSGFAKGNEACPVFEKVFEIDWEKVKKARLYATVHGIYEGTINGRRIGENYFAPGWTSYHKRLQYQTYDVTDMLSDHNILQFTLADGWYCGPYSYMMTRDNYGERTALLAELHIEFADGTRKIIHTDDTWTVREGSIRTSQIYLGETMDTTFDEEKAEKAYAIVIDEDKNNLVAQESEPVCITLKTAAKEFFITPHGEQVFDFGQNMSGVVELHVQGKKGQVVTVKHAETLDKNGNFYTKNLRFAKSTDTYICNGEEQVFCPHFTFHGFRYICVEGVEINENDVKLDNFIACTMNSDIEMTGSFHCSNEKVNQLWNNICWSMRDNFFDIPTDCPQRDERLGWTGDAQIFARTASYIGNTALFYEKWLHDLKAEQTAAYGVPQTVPNILGEDPGIAVWGDAATIIPWVIYETFGDVRVLAEQYDSMHGWVDYIHNHCEDNGLWQSGHQNGDWLALDKEESADRTGATDKYLVANAYYYKSCTIVAETARILGREKEAEKYEKLAEKIKDAFNFEYITQTGRILSETQTGCILALYFNLAKEQYRPRILKALLQNLKNHTDHISTGFVGTPYICHLLSETGNHELASTIFMQEDYPSWLYAVKKGATTIWERWNSIKPDGSFDESGMNSLNHYAYGSIGDWMFRKVLGIDIVKPGYKEFMIAPKFVQGITRAGGEYESVYGTIKSSWICEDGKITIDVTVPANTTAMIDLPDKPDILSVGSGAYHFEYETEIRLEKDRYTMDSTFSQLMEDPLTAKLLEKYAPGALDGPLIQMAMNLRISDLCEYSPEAKPLYEMILKELNQQP